MISGTFDLRVDCYEPAHRGDRRLGLTVVFICVGLTFGADPLTNDQLFKLEVAVLIPAALENQITMENAPDIKAKLVIEGEMPYATQ